MIRPVLIATAMFLSLACSAPVVAGPEDEFPGAILRPRPRPCLLPAGASFISMSDLDGGISPAGPVRGKWKLRFDRGRFSWTFSDMAVSGRFSCDGEKVRATTLSGSFSGVYDPAVMEIAWEGQRYEITGKHAAQRRRLLKEIQQRQQQDPVQSPQRRETPPSPEKPVPAPSWEDYHSKSSCPPLARSEQEMRGCTGHQDCVISCHVDGSCCGGQCGCGNALNRDFAARLKDWQAARCQGRGQYCPAVACMMRGPFFATCVDGLCRSSEGLGAIIKQTP